MKILLILPFFLSTVWAQPKPQEVFQSHKVFVNHGDLAVSKKEHSIGQSMTNILKLVDKGYVNQEVLKQGIKEAEKSKHFKVFLPWLNSIKNISAQKTAADLITVCTPFLEVKETTALEKALERSAGNYCRERSLEAIGREIDKEKAISDNSVIFIQKNLKFFLTKKNKKNFAFFLQSHSDKPEILKKVSQEVTTYSVQNNIVPSQEVLKDIMINEQITKLIQEKGFTPHQKQNVFYAEYGKLIEQGWRSLDNKPVEAKVKESFNFLKNYLELNQDHLPLGLCLTRMNDFAKAVFRGGFVDLSRDMYKFIIKKNSKDIVEDAIFFYMWTYIAANEFKDVLKIAEKENLLKDMNSINDPRLKFWIAVAYEKTDKLKDAVTYFENVISSSPLSYYSIMSVKKLRTLKPDSAMVNYYIQNAVKSDVLVSFTHNDLGDDHVSSLVRLHVWAKADHKRLMKLELKRLNNHSLPALLAKGPVEKILDYTSDHHLINAMIIQESKNYLNTFRYLYGVMDRKEVVFNRPLLEILYPRPYLDALSGVLKKDAVDPIVVLSLIRQESVFNPLAQSPVGARGLMQIMPATARGMKKSVRPKHLVNPKTNLELGTRYFKGLLKRYDGNLVYVLSAYNAGEGRVDRWKNLYFNNEETIIRNIEVIPFLETRNYVKLIFRNMFFYKLLLGQSDATDPIELNKIYDVSLGFNN